MTIDEVIKDLTERHDLLIERRNQAEEDCKRCDVWGDDILRRRERLFRLDAQVMMMTDIIRDINNKLHNEAKL